MAIAVVLETRIGRPIDEVFRHLVDLDRWPEWLVATGIRRMERGQTGPRSQASRCASSRPRRAGPGPSRLGSRRVDPPTHLSLSGKDADGVSIDISAQLVPVDDLVTILRWEVRIGLPFRFRIFESMARPQVERAVALDVDAFKRRLESVAGD